MARKALVPVSSAPPRSGVLVDGEGSASKRTRELQADNDELSETNRQLIAAMEEIQSLNVTLQSVNEALHTTNIELRANLDRARQRASDLGHLLDAIAVGVVLLNDAIELRDYNATASRYFTLTRRDIGRSISRVRHELGQTSLLQLCRDALDSGEPLERIITSSSGELVSLRIREIELGGSSPGLMLTVTELADCGLDQPRSRFA